MPKLLTSLFFCFVLLIPGVVRGEPTAARFHYPATAKQLYAPEWRRDFVRSLKNVLFVAGPGTQCADLFERMALPKELPENYLLNQADGATHMYDWYRGQSKETFIEAIARQHKISAVGPDGKRIYWNNGAPVPYSSETVSPGVFRAELAKPTIVGDEFSITKDELAIFAKYGFLPKGTFVPAIPGVPKRLTVPTNAFRRSNEKFTRELPTGEAEPIYRAAVIKQAEKVRGWMKLSEAEVKKQTGAFVKDLAQFYYVGIHWMPFDSVNNSIFMAQINVVLRHQGFKSLEHGRLDYLALVSPPEVFAKVFAEEFKKQNP